MLLLLSPDGQECPSQANASPSRAKDLGRFLIAALKRLRHPKAGRAHGSKRNAHSKPYTPKEVDSFAAYVIPEDEWYLIPAAVLSLGKQKKALTLLPENPRHPERYRYEEYR
jgi:hypothetical protein